MKKKTSLYGFLILAMMLSMAACQDTSKVGNKTGNEADGQVFSITIQQGVDHRITYADGEQLSAKDNQPLVFVDGALQKTTKCIVDEGAVLIALDFLQENLNLDAKINQGEIVIETNEQGNSIAISQSDNTITVNGVAEPIRVKTIDHALYIEPGPLMKHMGYSCVCRKVGDKESLVTYYDAIYLDKEAAGFKIDDAVKGMETAKGTCAEALGSFTASLRNNLKQSGEDENRFDEDLQRISRDISNMSYIGEVSRFYLYDMDVYRVYVDKSNGDVYFNYTTGLENITKSVAGSHAHTLYMPLYIIG